MRQEYSIPYLILYTETDQIELKISEVMIPSETILFIKDNLENSIGIVTC